MSKHKIGILKMRKQKENALTLGVKKTRTFSTVVQKDRVFDISGKFFLNFC